MNSRLLLIHSCFLLALMIISAYGINTAESEIENSKQPGNSMESSSLESNESILQLLNNHCEFMEKDGKILVGIKVPLFGNATKILKAACRLGEDKNHYLMTKSLLHYSPEIFGVLKTIFEIASSSQNYDLSQLSLKASKCLNVFKDIAVAEAVRFGN